MTTGRTLARSTIVGCVAIAAVVSSGCSGSKVTTKASAELRRYAIHSMVLVPFTSIATPQVRDEGDLFFTTPRSLGRADLSGPSTVEPPVRQTATLSPYASEKITQLFWGRLQHRKGIHVVAHTAKNLAGDTYSTPEARGAAVAQRLKADAALVGEVSVYQERVGSRLGANPPASVGFAVKVVAADGQVLWAGNYYERQRPMIEDFIGFVQRWGAFVTAEELARYGVDRVLKEFPFGSEGD